MIFGTREELAEFVLQHEGRIRSIARRKLSPGAKSAFGSEDVFLTVVRRLDAMAAEGLIRAESEGQLWALIRSVAEHVSLHRSRLIESTASRSGEDASFWSGVCCDFRRCRSDTEAFALLIRMMHSLSGQTDRQIFSLRLRGVSHRVIAQQVGCTAEAARQRWQGIRRELQLRFSEDTSCDHAI
ncbi:hypothetical protein MNBD_PLANCTO03-2091 [hydrothermal vent metagenome]|uniref:Sigma-70 family RNA polymerase sigma factor n=1 Tax=hydrothermal vent metagenome TaxID=652676 RepID=A0A3B1DB38_9ZZZZ